MLNTGKRTYPPPHYEFEPTDGPQLEHRRHATDEYNRLRLALGVSDNSLSPFFGVPASRLGRWGRGTTDVPFWAILRLRELLIQDAAA